MSMRLLQSLIVGAALAAGTQLAYGDHDKDSSGKCDHKGAKKSALKQSGSSGSQASKEASSHVRLSKLFGSKATTKDGQDLGTINDALLDQNGQIKFVLLGGSASGGRAGDLAPIPWEAVNLQSERECVLNVDQNKLRSAPRLSEEQFSQLDAPDYVVRIYEFYEIAPPTEAMGAPGELPGGIEQGSGEQEDTELDEDIKDFEQDMEDETRELTPDTK